MPLALRIRAHECIVSAQSASYSSGCIPNAGILVGVPLLAGFILSRLIADPVFYVIEQRVPLAFAPTDAQKVSSYWAPDWQPQSAAVSCPAQAAYTAAMIDRSACGPCLPISGQLDD